MKRILFILLLFRLTDLFSQQEPVLREFIIGDAKTACLFNNTITSCLKVKYHPDSNWREFPYEIEGFIFEPGVETRVAVNETPILFPEDGGPKFTYKLVKVLEKRNTVLTQRALLANNKWKILNLEKDLNLTPARKAGAYLVFDLDSQTVSGFGGCNGIGGNARIEDGVIQFENVMRTLISCGNDDIENKIMEGLNGKAAFYIRNNILFIVCENRMTIHLRGEKKIDSLVREVSKPVQVSRGNSFSDMKNGHYTVALEDVKEAVNKYMVFEPVKLSATEKKTIRIRLKNINAEDPVAEIRILSKPHKKPGYYYATVILRNGTRKSIIIRNAG